jgi:hypothetical protein
MRAIILASAIVLCAASAQAQSSSRGSGGYPTYGSSPTYGTGSNPSSHGVEGYSTNNGTYVQPHQQTNPNGTQYDNYGTRGNVNPYNGQTGTRAPKY